MLKESKIVGLIGLLFTIAGFLGKSVYRDFVYSNHVNDYGFAGFLPSYFYVVGFSFLLLIRPTQFPKSIIAIVTIFSLLFEVKQWISSQVFDFYDCIASLIGGITALLVLKFIRKQQQKSA